MKLAAKIRKGSRLIRRDDAPHTPVERVCMCPDADPDKVAALRRLLEWTDPFDLSRRIDSPLQRLYCLAHRPGGQPREVLPFAGAPTGALALARLDVQLLDPATRCQNTGPTVGPGATITRRARESGKGKKRQPRTPEAPVRFSDDATNRASVIFSNGLTGKGESVVRDLPDLYLSVWSAAVAFKRKRKEILKTVRFDPAYFFDNNSELWRIFTHKLAAGSACNK